MDYLEFLKQEFDFQKDNYDFFLEKSEKESKKTIISKGFLFDMRPFENEIAGFKKGKECQSFPKNTKNVIVYHFNDKEQIIMIEEYGQAPNIINREFFIYADNTLKSLYYSSGGNDLKSIRLSIFDKEKTINVFNHGKYGISIKKYIYEGELLRKIQIKSKEFDDIDFSDSELVFEYADNRELEIITEVYPDEEPRELYPDFIK